MSADTYYLIRRHPRGGFTPVMGFMSDEGTPEVGTARNYPSYPTVQEAIGAVIGEYTEYGIMVHEECAEPKTPTEIAQEDALKTDQEKLSEISRLLHEGYEHYFTYEGHCKSSEGHITVDYGNFWDRAEDPSDMRIRGVGIYSYVFCTQGRDEYFDSLDDALATVREWHAREMAYDPNTEEAIAEREAMDALAVEFIDKMVEDGRLTIIDVTDELDELLGTPTDEKKDTP